MHILVTGGAGFIGSHLTERLLELQHRVTVLDNFDPFYDPRIKQANLSLAAHYDGFSLVHADIRDTARVEGLFAGSELDAVVHLAGLAGVRQSLGQPLEFNSVNIDGTVVLLEAARKFGRPRFIFASTSSVYGLSASIPYREDDPLLQPVSPYGATKIAGEKYCHIYHAVHGLCTCALRFFTAYGPRQRPDMAIHRFARAILRGEEIALYGDGSTSRDYTYVGDIVGGIIAALDLRQDYAVLNLGNSTATGLLALVRLLEIACGAQAGLKYLPEQPGDPPHTCADISQAQAVLGYDPQTPLSVGIPNFVHWLQQQPQSAVHDT